MQLRNILALTLSCSLLAACGGGGSSSGSDFTPPPAPAIVAAFDPANGVIPFPNNLLFSGTTDLTLNIPVADPSDPAAAPTLALNALDGFSTVAPWSASFSAKVDPTTLKPGDTVRVFQVNLSGPAGAVVGIDHELSSPADYVVAVAPSDTDGKTIAIVPTKALKPMTSYMAVITDGVEDSSGTGATPSLTYTLAKGAAPLCVDGKSTNGSLTDAQACQLEPVRKLVNAQEAAAASAGVKREDISLSWVATTESTTTVLQALTAKIDNSSTTAPIQVAPTGMTLGDLGLGLAPIADVYIGAMQVPYYLGVPSAQNPTAALTGFWKAAPGAYVPPADQFGLDPTSTNVTAYNPFPVANTTLGIPVIMTVPNAASGKVRPANGWPIVIFQHGITRNRTDMLGVAQTFAAQGIAVIAIDAPLHGVDSTSPFYIGNTPFGAIAHERTFDLDLSNNDTGAAGPDGKVDASGTYFINLQSLLTSRDNVRQAVADLVELEHAIPSISYDGGAKNFDGSQIGFVGQSLGGIIGTVFTAVDSNVHAAVLNVAGGGIARLLDGSVSIGPQIHAGLAAAGVQQGTPAYDQFFMAAQSAIDSADPINFAPLLAASSKGVLLQEVVGGGSKPSDQVVPNNVAGAPLSGTDPLIPALGLTQINASTSGNPLHVVTRFNSGVHGSLLSPASDAAVTQEMQTEMAYLIASGGHAVQVAVPSVLVAPAAASSSE
jgi:dienelactone hydrolase